jgi:hypothetical protein
MANGRLGKAKISPLTTTVVYDNTSGAEASVSILAQANSAVPMSLRIDGTNDAVSYAVTLASETYQVNYIVYDVGNTTLTTGSPAYNGRFQFRTITGTPSGPYYVYEFYSGANATLYTTSGNANFNTSTTIQPMLFSAYNSATGLGDPGDGRKNPNAIMVAVPGGTNRGQMALYATPTTADAYYKRVWARDNSGSQLSQATTSYNEGQQCVDYHNQQTVLTGFSMHNSSSAIMGFCAYPQGGSNTISTYSYTSSNSIMYRCVNGNPSFPGTSNQSHPQGRLVNRICLFDMCGSSDRFGFATTADSYYDPTTYTTEQIAKHIVWESRNGHFRFDSSTATRDGGQVLYFDYNPNTQKYYFAARNSSQAYLYEIDRPTFVSAVSGGQVSTGTLGSDYSGSGFTLINSDFELPFNNTSNYPNTEAQHMQGRTQRIGDSLWVLSVNMRNDTSLAAEIFYSTDLQTWTSAVGRYSPYDYNLVQDVTTIRSDSGTVTATKTNIGNVGTDGVLEESTSIVQYERTGLVLSNNDRVVAYNGATSGDDLVVQVMGYEGT